MPHIVHVLLILSFLYFFSLLWLVALNVAPYRKSCHYWRLIYSLYSRMISFKQFQGTSHGQIYGPLLNFLSFTKTWEQLASQICINVWLVPRQVLISPYFFQAYLRRQESNSVCIEMLGTLTLLEMWSTIPTNEWLSFYAVLQALCRKVYQNCIISIGIPFQ